MSLNDRQYKEIYDNIPLTILEDNNFPTNYNLLQNRQGQLFKEVVDYSLKSYYDNYVDLLKMFKEELQILSGQVQEAINEATK